MTSAWERFFARRAAAAARAVQRHIASGARPYRPTTAGRGLDCAFRPAPPAGLAPDRARILSGVRSSRLRPRRADPRP